MRKGRHYHCKNCGNDYSAFLGIGFLFPQYFEEVQEKVRKGRYGKKWQTLINSEEFVVADAKKRFVYGEELEQDYRLLHKRTHRCPKCRKTMICLTNEQLDNHVFDKLTCPKCGTENESSGILMWD